MLVRTFIITVFSLLMSGSILPAMAATAGRESPSNLAVWIFLGFCALIIVAVLGTLVRGESRKQSAGNVVHVDAEEQLKSH